MNIKLTFRHMDHSDAIEEYVQKQLAKIKRILEHERSPIYVELTLSPSDVHRHHRVELLIKSPHYDLMSEYEHAGTDFYDAINHVITVMYRRLLEAKDRLKTEEKDGYALQREMKKPR